MYDEQIAEKLRLYYVHMSRYEQFEYLLELAFKLEDFSITLEEQVVFAWFIKEHLKDIIRKCK